MATKYLRSVAGSNTFAWETIDISPTKYYLTCHTTTNVISWETKTSGGDGFHRALICDDVTKVIGWSSSF